MVKLDTSGRGGAANAPIALKQETGREANAKLAQGDFSFPDVAVERHAEVLAFRHRIPLTHARVFAEAVRP